MTETASTRPDDDRSTRGRLVFLGVVALVAVAGGLVMFQGAGAEPTTIQVYKTPTCGCCEKWIDHLREAGFSVTSTDLPDLASLKATNGVPSALASCHTAMVEGYVVEGHVPARDIERLLAERPAVAGLAVPGMPMGSPGMEHPDASRHETYAVLAFGGDAAGHPRVFAQHAP